MRDHVASGRLFPGKVLLFGEHSIIDGSAALIVPLHRYSAGLTFLIPEADRNRAVQSNRHLRTFAAYLRENGFQTNLLEEDLKQGLWLRSDIPVHYGTGSSGAAVAAVFDAYRDKGNTPDGDLPALKRDLAGMESFFHGKSSGIDPLCIYLDKALVVEESGKPALWQRLPTTTTRMQAFLIDTGIPGETGKVVGRFRERLKDAGFRKSYAETYIPQVDAIVKAYTTGVLDSDMLRKLSELQLSFFSEAIPEAFIPLWKKGLSGGRYILKLCGSGGGGFLLGFTTDFPAALHAMQPHPLAAIEV